MDEGQRHRITQLEAEIAQLTEALVRAKDAVQSWVEANSDLSRSAAEARAKNQGAGRGIVSGLLGPKFRAIARAGASASNAAIAKNVAQKRAQIAEGKRNAQDSVKQIQQQLVRAKDGIKQLKMGSKERQKAKTSGAKAAGATLDLMHKLKEARDAGVLTDQEYESKRQKLLSEL